MTRQTSHNRIITVLLSSITFLSISAQEVTQFSHLTRSQISLDGRTQLYAVPSAQRSGEAVLMGFTDKPVPAGVEMPEAMQEWLLDVQRATQYANQHPEALLGAEALQNSSSTTIAPLLGDIEWDQGAPYSNLCPSGTPVGCVATAMAQVMYYYKYPAQGNHSHTWTWDGKTHSVDFGATTYDWNLMYPKHHSSDSQESNDEVAKLSYHCGISVDMMYRSDGSGSYLERIPYALAHYFGYNPKVASTFRPDYTYDQWNEHLIAELEAGRPVLFSGTSEEGGHAFVIDGRNAQGLYHVNWGWNGSYNGYYDICILNPDGAGTGAVPSANGFSLNQTAIVQCCPDDQGEFVSPLHFGAINVSEYSYKTKVSCWLENKWNGKVKARVGLEYRNTESGEATQKYSETVTFQPLYTWGQSGSAYFNLNQDIEVGDLADGQYLVQPCYQWLDQDSILMYPLHVYYSCPSLHIQVDNGQHQVVSIDDQSDFGLIHEILTEIPDTLSLGHPYPIQITYTNSSTDFFSGYTCFYFEKPDDWRNTLTSGETELVLQPGETKTLEVTLELNKEGHWNSYLLAGSYNLNNDWLLEYFDFMSVFTNESPSELYMLSAPEILTEKPEVGGMVDFQVVVGNKGGDFASQIELQVYKTKGGLGNPVEVYSQDAVLPMGCQGDTILITADLSDTKLKGMTKYHIIPYWIDVHGNAQRFTYENGTSVGSIEFKVYNASGIEAIQQDDDNNAPAYDLFGRPARQGRLLIRQGKVSVVGQ